MPAGTVSQLRCRMRRVWGPTLHGNHLRRLGVTVDGLAIFTQATNDKWSDPGARTASSAAQRDSRQVVRGDRWSCSGALC